MSEKIDNKIEQLADQYNSCLAKKQEFHDIAQKCLGAIELLNEMKKEEEECQDSEKEVKKT
jgi:hypothetical protein